MIMNYTLNTNFRSTAKFVYTMDRKLVLEPVFTRRVLVKTGSNCIYRFTLAYNFSLSLVPKVFLKITKPLSSSSKVYSTQLCQPSIRLQGT